MYIYVKELVFCQVIITYNDILNFMKNIIEFLGVENIKKENINNKYDDLFKMVQNDRDDGAAYETHDFSDTENEFKKGFISLTKGDHYFVFMGTNSGEDFANLLMGDEDSFDYLDNLEVGERYEDRDSITFRIW